MGLLDHQELAIIKGVGKTPGDTQSAEQDPVVLNLLDDGSGISLDLDRGWEPNIPSLKSGGVWADSPIRDGRTLLSGQNTNVVETMRLIVSAQTTAVYAAKFAQLQRMVQDCRAFWDSEWQIEPVYLKWWASGAPGPQYAPIYNIDMDVVLEESEDSQAHITLSIERECGWLGVAPGTHPLQWKYFIENRPWYANPDWDYLFNASELEFLFSGTVYNRTEFGADPTVIATPGYLDIDGADVPGDLPALAMIGIDMGDNTTGGGYAQTYVSRSTKPRTYPIRALAPPVLPPSTDTANQIYDLPASAAQLETDAAFANDTGATLYPPENVNRRRAEISFASGTANAHRLTWRGDSGQDFTLSVQALRGRFMVFLRARQVGGAAGNILMSLQASVGDVDYVTLSEVIPTIQAGTGNTTTWPLSYMGVVQFPLNGSVVMHGAGAGLQIKSGINDLTVKLFARRTTGTAVLYVSDLILIPIDEESASISLAAGGYDAIWFVDSTGYMSRGKGEMAVAVAGAGVGVPVAVEFRGQAITLIPGVDNRIYVLRVQSGDKAPVVDGGLVGVNIVPRWSGVRDV